MKTPIKEYSYVKFQSPVPPGKDLEPVYEFKLDTKDKRYKADKITREGDTVYLHHGATIQETPWVNVAFARPVT
jgi:hypothetical protein